MKIISIVGARPQFVKASILTPKLRKKYDEILIHTGQHYDYELSKVFFNELNIPKPDYLLGINSKTPSIQIGQMVISIDNVLKKEKPNIVIVYGDTNSTLAGALAAVNNEIPVFHIEAGLRSFDKSMPEEINRIITDHISKVLFTPTKTAVTNLKKENIYDGIIFCGDIMYDVLLENIKKANNTEIINKLNIVPNQYHLLTIHRKNNADDKEKLCNIFKALKEIEDTVIFPAHPRTIKMIKQYNIKKRISKNVRIINPVSYLEFINLQKNCIKVITDSGGIQKEAYMLKKPCITLRSNTEWTETVKAGWNILVGTNIQSIIKAVNTFKPKGKQKVLFGNGKTSDIIVNTIKKYKI